jgi:hypothetical protein
MSDPNTPTGGSGGYDDPGGYGQGGYGEGGPGQGGPPPPAGGSQARRPAPEPNNFFAALFDFSFNTFVTPMIVRVVYILFTVVIALGLLFWVVVAFTQSAVAGVGVLLLGWIPALLYLAFFRMALEMYYAIVRMSQDINRRLPGA